MGSDDFSHIHESLTFPLFFLYLLVFLLCVIQIGRIIWNRHNLVGWHTGFLALCAIWAVPRALFFLLLDFFNNISQAWITAALYWFPENIQFATFSLLILFYARLVYKSNGTWHSRAQWFGLTFVVVNTLFLCATIVSVAITGAVGSSAELNSAFSWENKLWTSISAVIFITLGCVLAYYGWRVSQLMKEGKIQIPFQIKKRSNMQAVVVTALVFLIFTSRAIYELVESFGGVNITITTGLSWRNALIFLFFFVWEIVPTCLIILLFWNIPSSPAKKPALLPGREGNYTRVTINTHNELPRLKTAMLFDNPQRYDSDEEVSVSPYNTTSPYNTSPDTIATYGTDFRN